MDEKFKNKYRIASARAPWWDYGSDGAYFITICTKNRCHYFGAVDRGGIMQLSAIGKIAEQEWIKTPGIRPDMGLTLGEFVVMPNHFHGIVIIGDPRSDSRRDAMHRVSTRIGTGDMKPKNQFGPQSKNLASIMRGFKSAVTQRARIMHIDFAWQSRFHDHIIRDEYAYHRISQYIVNNPTNWAQDRFYGN